MPPFNSGGLGEACLGLSKSLALKGADITFVLPQKVDVKSDFMKIVFANVDAENEDLIFSVYTTIETWAKERNVKLKYSDLPSGFLAGAIKYGKMIKKIAVKCAPDVIHAHDWLTFPAGIAAKEATGAPLVVHVHSTEYDRTGGNNPNKMVEYIEKCGLESADKIIAISRMQKNTLVENYSINPDKIDIVYNGAAFFCKQPLSPTLTYFKDLGYKIVLFLGRITLQKGPEYFVSAAKRVLDVNDKVVFVVTGSGDMMGQMIADAMRLGVMKNFIFTGFVRGEEKDRIYQSADLYVMPSVSEPFGLTALESIGNSTPVLISKQSGVSEVVNHALKIDFWDTESMADKILAALKYPALLSVLRQESKRELPLINWDNSADKCLNLYQSLTINH